MSQKTLVILKPDCVTRGLIAQVTQRLENTGLMMVACKMSNLSTEILEDHYGHLKDKPFFPSIVSYMQSSPVMIQVWEGENAVAKVRKNIGITNPLEAAPGTIRGDFALTIDMNIIHASEDESAANEEINRFFEASDVTEY